MQSGYDFDKLQMQIQHSVIACFGTNWDQFYYSGVTKFVS